MLWILYGTFPTLYEIYLIYHYLLTLHGVYVTISYLQWWLGVSYDTLVYIISYAYDIRPYPQLEDKKDK